MLWSRKRRLRSFLIGLGILAAPLGASTVLAQPIDPFRPLNSQYDAYRYPIGPASPDGGQSAPMALSGIRGANQFQNYLDELQGTGARAATAPASALLIIEQRSTPVSTRTAAENTAPTEERTPRSSRRRR